MSMSISGTIVKSTQKTQIFYFILHNFLQLFASHRRTNVCVCVCQRSCICTTALTLACHSNSQQLFSACIKSTHLHYITIFFFFFFELSQLCIWSKSMKKENQFSFVRMLIFIFFAHIYSSTPHSFALATLSSIVYTHMCMYVLCFSKYIYFLIFL